MRRITYSGAAAAAAGTALPERHRLGVFGERLGADRARSLERRARGHRRRPAEAERLDVREGARHARRVRDRGVARRIVLRLPGHGRRGRRGRLARVGAVPGVRRRRQAVGVGGADRHERAATRRRERFGALFTAARRRRGRPGGLRSCRLGRRAHRLLRRRYDGADRHQRGAGGGSNGRRGVGASVGDVLGAARARIGLDLDVHPAEAGRFEWTWPARSPTTASPGR